MTEPILKKISQEELNNILEQHKLWVESDHKQGKQADLSYHDLRELGFPNGANLKEAYLKGADLKGANLRWADLRWADLRWADLKGADLKGADLEGADLEGANLRWADLKGADLEGANLRWANLEGANLEGADLRWANLEGANLVGVDLRNTILENKQSENLEKEIIQHKLKVSQLENELKQAKLENNQSEEQQEKIAKLEKQLKLAEQAEDELKEIKKVRDNIDEANQALTTALTNTDTQIKSNQEFAKELQKKAIGLILLDIVFIVSMPFCALFVTPFYNLLKEVGVWGILFLTFPILLILLIALSLLRHQKQLIAEIRHYSMLKHKIELYGGILKASQHMANSVIALKNSDNAQSAEYIQKVFDEIKTELLKSPNFDLNTQPQIFPEEGGGMIEVLKPTFGQNSNQGQ